MNKLKNQVFVVIFLILTLFTTIVFCTFNTIIYKQQFSMIERTLNQASKMHFRMDMPPGGFNRDNTENDDIEDIRFMETTVYTVLLDSDDRIVKIINHSDNGVSDEEIEDLAVTMISQSYQKSIGNLYFFFFVQLKRTQSFSKMILRIMMPELKLCGQEVWHIMD